VTDPVEPDPRPLDPAVQRVVDAAARKGVALRITQLAETSHTAEDAARALGVGQAQIVKSLVFVVDASHGVEPILCLVAGTNRVDLARLAAVTGERGIRRATAREARELTGFTIGGIPPLGHARHLRVVMDPDLGRYPVVWAAAGMDRAVFPVTPAALRALTNAMVAPLAEDAPLIAPLAEDAPAVAPQIAIEPLPPTEAEAAEPGLDNLNPVRTQNPVP
jgi:prolyl-tRNA editing enzyme YbaK/EbsC (Cys-tRNA(Pro) deacylase)